MQNNVLIPWDSVYQDNIWFNEVIVEQPTINKIEDDSFFGLNPVNVILCLLIYNVVLFISIMYTNENLLYRKNKIVKERQR